MVDPIKVYGNTTQSIQGASTGPLAKSKGAKAQKIEFVHVEGSDKATANHFKISVASTLEKVFGKTVKLTIKEGESAIRQVKVNET